MRVTKALKSYARLPDDSWLEWKAGDPVPARLVNAVDNGASVAAHNWERFDRFIWQKLGWPEPRQTVDTQKLARLAGLPAALDNLGEALYDKGKDKQGQDATRRLSCLDRKSGKLPRVDPDILAKVVSYCRRDVEIISAAWVDRFASIHCVDADTRHVDQVINDRGFVFDVKLAEAIIELEDALVQEAIDASPVDHEVLSSPKQLCAWLADRGIAVSNARRETLQKLVNRNDLDDDVRSAIAARLADSRITTHKLRSGLRMVCPDGRLRDTLVYHGAHTGRWAGRGIQPQNLPRGASVDVDLAVSATLNRDLSALRTLAATCQTTLSKIFATLVRACIGAPQGRNLAVVDYAQIEARALLWMAGDAQGLDRYRRGQDSYRYLASQLFHVPLEAVTKEQRQLGKALVLGCGYGMGAQRFKGYAADFGVDWDAAPLAPKQAVEAWRDAHIEVAGARYGRVKNGHICREGGLWRDLQRSAHGVVTRGGVSASRRCTWSSTHGGASLPTSQWSDTHVS